MNYYVWVNNQQLNRPYESEQEAVSFIQRCCSPEDQNDVRDQEGRLRYSSRFPGKDWDKRTSDD